MNPFFFTVGFFDDRYNLCTESEHSTTNVVLLTDALLDM